MDPNLEKIITEKRRSSIHRNTLLAFLAYLIPISAAYLAKVFGLARFNYTVIHLVLLTVFLSTLLYCLMVQARRKITRRFANYMTLIEILGYLIISTVWAFHCDNLRVLFLYSSLLAFTYVFFNASLLVSFITIIVVTIDYILISYISIYHLYQSGSLGMDLFQTYIFVPICFFMAYAAERFKRQGEEVKQSKREIERYNKNLQQTLTDLNTAQEQLVQSEKMASLGGLVAGVAHEINTPLGVAITATSHLSDTASRLTQLYREDALKRSDLEKLFHVIETSCRLSLNNLNRAADLVVNFKQVAADQTAEKKRVFNVRRYIEEVLASLRPGFRQAGHTVEFTCPEDIEMYSNPGLFYQIFSNLVMNSVLHGFAGRRNGKVAIHIVHEESHLLIHYSDDGEGMDSETLQKMFDPFFTTRRGKGGTGLGMHILYNLVHHSLKGTLECTSTPGSGVVFLIRIPIPPIANGQSLPPH